MTHTRPPIGAMMLLALAVGAAVAAPALAPHNSDTQFPRLLHAPPTRVHIHDATGRWRGPFIHPWRLVNQLEQRYEPDRTVAVPLTWFTAGHVAQSVDETRAPFLPLGTDSYGRDVLAQLLYGARASIGLSLAAAVGALSLGALLGAWAGYTGHITDDLLMRGTEFILVLPAMYVTLALRAVLPLVLAPTEVFLLMATIFTILGAPVVARGVRAIVRSERHLEYVIAAESLGASRVRILSRHLLPATAGFLQSQLTLLVPAFVVAEATLSYVGLGFPESVASWGTMLHDASNLRALSDFPWLLSPAVAMFMLVLGLNLLGGVDRAAPAGDRTASFM
jgi:peptide/nickel transport system permease protein